MSFTITLSGNNSELSSSYFPPIDLDGETGKRAFFLSTRILRFPTWWKIKTPTCICSTMPKLKCCQTLVENSSLLII
ncbi:Hypothetical protein NTJ_08494 [Nesidiocoris tenuis]|uniref:Uncharacterized protein n=1 Tax=Nesidiocoris tenuis TaxID=355587 RepID=A0ABN7ATZ7_9HEMI|nr:Hypothetical protein NTJ_08494 [Nesidiocoris tenuis]